MISSVVSDRTVVIAPTLRHVKALNALLGEALPSEVVKFEKGDDWNAQPDDKIIYIQIEQPLVQVGRSSYRPATTEIEEFINVADFLSTNQSFIVTEEFSTALIDRDGYRYGNKELGVTSEQVLARVPEHLAQPEG
jgi:hypothetical protein